MGFHDDAIKAEQQRRAKADADAKEYVRKLTEERESALRQWFDSVGMSPHPRFTSTEPIEAVYETYDGPSRYTYVEMSWSVDGYEYSARWMDNRHLTVYIHIAGKFYQVEDRNSIGRVLLDNTN